MCSESLQNGRVCRPYRHEPKTLQTGSNRHLMSEISHSVRFAKQTKNLLTVQSVQLMWQGRTNDVAGDVSR
jgi:hypothetical protein